MNPPEEQNSHLGEQGKREGTEPRMPKPPRSKGNECLPEMSPRPAELDRSTVQMWHVASFPRQKECRHQLGIMQVVRGPQSGKDSQLPVCTAGTALCKAPMRRAVITKYHERNLENCSRCHTMWGW